MESRMRCEKAETADARYSGETLGEACGVRSGSNEFFVGSRGLFPALPMWGLTVP